MTPGRIKRRYIIRLKTQQYRLRLEGKRENNHDNENHYFHNDDSKNYGLKSKEFCN